MEVFNKSDILERLDNDEELCKEIVEVFIEETPLQIDALKKDLEYNDISALQFQAHALKGSAANTSAERISALALEMETACKTSDSVTARSCIENIELEFENFKETVASKEMIL